jgi:hypothetical protein
LILDVRGGYAPPPVFWQKRLQSIENKGKELEKERQESSRGGKRLEAKEIEEVEGESEFGRGTLVRRGAGETMLRQVFTSYNRTNYLSCQYIKWVLVFRDWAQSRGPVGSNKMPSDGRMRLSINKALKW